ncbi:hypothetical protein PHISP_08634, partial [Aspergillus sp. HF37]
MEPENIYGDFGLEVPTTAEAPGSEAESDIHRQEGLAKIKAIARRPMMTTTQTAAHIFEAFISLRVMGTAPDASSFDDHILSLSLADLGNQVDANALL